MVRNMRRYLFIVVVLFLTAANLFAQNNSSKVVFQEPKGGYWDTIQKGIDAYLASVDPQSKRKVLKADFSAIKAPAGPQDFKYAWHNKPLEPRHNL